MSQTVGIKLLSFRDLCDLTGVSDRQMRRYIKEGKLPRGRIFGKRELWTEDEAVAWIKSMPRVGEDGLTAS